MRSCSSSSPPCPPVKSKWATQFWSITNTKQSFATLGEPILQMVGTSSAQGAKEPPRSASAVPAYRLRRVFLLSAAGVWYGLELERAIGKHEVRTTPPAVHFQCLQPALWSCSSRQTCPCTRLCTCNVQGTVLGVTYFVAPRKHATFVRRENLSVYDQEVEASVRVQGALRMSIARRRARNELTQRAFNALDADEEVRELESEDLLKPPW